MNIKINFILFKKLVLLTLIVLFALNLSGQTKKLFSIQLNGGSFSLGVSDPPYDNEITVNFFLAPSLKFNKSELILGPLWSKREPFEYDTPKFNTGLLAGYKYHILKEPRWFQFDLEYNAKLVRWSGNILVPDHNNSYNESWKITDLHHFFGYGITLFLSKNKNAYFFHSLGYGWTMRLNNSRSYNDSKYFNHLRYNTGIGFQIY
jgi:hypothetical protein